MHSDNELMRMAQADDRPAFETLVLRWRERALHFADSIVHDTYAAEDIVQDSFVRIYLHRTRYRPDYSFRTYLYAVVRNGCIDHLRTHPALPTQDTFFAGLESRSHGPESTALRRAALDAAIAALHTLHPDYRTALYLAAVEGLSGAQIAQIMRKTVPQVKLLLHRARKCMKKQCGEDGWI